MAPPSPTVDRSNQRSVSARGRDEADFATTPPREQNGLASSLRGPARLADGGGFAVKIVLTNTSNAPIGVYDRDNSWGADQWRLDIVDANGVGFIAGKSVNYFSPNWPSGIAIAPHDEFALDAVVRAKPARHEKGQPFDTREQFTLPVRVRAVFDATASPPISASGARGATHRRMCT